MRKLGALLLLICLGLGAPYAQARGDLLGLTGAGGKITVVAAGGSAPVLQSSAAAFPTASSSTSVTVTKPTGTVSGDLLVFAYSPFFIGSFTSYTPPSGLTLVDSQCPATPYPCIAIYYKVAGGAEPANYTFASSGTMPYNGAAVALRITGQNATTPVNISAKQITTTGGTTTGNFPTATTTAANTLILHFAGGSFTANPSGSTWPTLVPTGYAFANSAVDLPSQLGIGADSKTQAAAGATGSATVTIPALDTAFSAFTVAIAP